MNEAASNNAPDPVHAEKTAIAIDLGTTFSVVAHINHDGRPETIVNDEGELNTASVVYFDTDGPVVGTEAVNAAEFEPARAAQFVKRDIGSELFTGNIYGYQFPPEVIQALILKKLKTDAELRLGPVQKAVITVPAYFNEPRRKATQDAGELAGLEVIDIINEPTAAAMAYGASQGFLDERGETKQTERVLVYDLGGGTFDVTLMEIEKNQFRAIATAGDVHLGGIDWDERLVTSLAAQFQTQTGIDLSQFPVSYKKLRHLATRAKKTLTARTEAAVRMAHENHRAQLQISRAQFEELTFDLVERTRLTVHRLLKDASMQWSDVTRLLLVGGSTRMPMIGAMLEKESGMEIDRSLSPDEAVAHGAAVYAGILTGDQGFAGSGVSVTNVNSHDLGVLGINPSTGQPKRQVMIPRNSLIPVKKRRKFITSKENQKEIVVNVVEGGTATGEGATRIGKCRVMNLPPVLPKGSEIFVTFEYAADGRLSVHAELPNTDIKAESTIARSSGMSEQEMVDWKIKIDAGIQIDADGNSDTLTKTSAEPIDFQQASGGAPSTVPAPVLAAPIVTAPVAPGANAPQGEIPVAPVASTPQPASAPVAPTAPVAPAASSESTAQNVPSGIAALANQPDRATVSDIHDFLDINQSRQFASDTNIILTTDANPAANAGESILDVLGTGDKKPRETDNDALDNFFKGLGG